MASWILEENASESSAERIFIDTSELLSFEASAHFEVRSSNTKVEEK
jgi:hypothetical protein